MPRVVGVDWSLTKTGVGVVTQRADGSTLATGAVLRHPWKTTAPQRAKAGLPKKLPLTERRDRIRTAVDDVLRVARGADVVVIEGLVMSGPGRSADLIAGWWLIVGPLVKAGVPVGEMARASMAKAITDDGRADKSKTSVTISKLYPEIEIESDDVADGVGLAHLGAVVLGWNVPTLKRHHEVKWTEHPFAGAGPVEARAA